MTNLVDIKITYGSLDKIPEVAEMTKAFNDIAGILDSHSVMNREVTPLGIMFASIAEDQISDLVDNLKDLGFNVTKQDRLHIS